MTEPSRNVELKAHDPDPGRTLGVPGHVVGEDVVVAQPERAA